MQFARDILARHGEEDVLVVFPNSKRAYQEISKVLRKEFPEATLTYFRSDLTVGVAAEQRTMIAYCKPLPPEDAYNWLATHYQREQGGDIRTFSEMLRLHSARQAFYQTIGRVKDPKATVPSVVYCYGLRYMDIQLLLGDFPQPVVLEDTHKSMTMRLMTGTHWRRTAELIPVPVAAAVEFIGKGRYVRLTQLEKLLSEENFKILMQNLSTFGLQYDSDKRRIINPQETLT